MKSKYFKRLLVSVKLSRLKSFLISKKEVITEKTVMNKSGAFPKLVKYPKQAYNPTASTKPTEALNRISLENSTVAKTRNNPIRILKLTSEYQQAERSIAT